MSILSSLSSIFKPKIALPKMTTQTSTPAILNPKPFTLPTKQPAVPNYTPFNSKGVVVGGTALMPIGGMSMNTGSTTPQKNNFAVQPTPQVKAPAPAPTVATAPKTTAPVTPSLKPADDPSNKYNTATGELNPKYTGYTAPKTDTKKTSEKPAVPSLAEKAVTDAEKLYQKSLELSSDEMATQGDLDRLIEGTKKAYTGTKDQTIPMQFITGQLASIEERALNLAQPLEQKLARLQAARTATQEASRFALDRADKRLEAEKKVNEPMTVGSGSTIIRKNPTTGEYETVFRAPTDEKRSATYQEYLDARKEGYTGSFDKFRNESSGLTQSQTLNRIDKLSNNFGDEPVVKRYATIAEGLAQINGIADNSTNPADNQALIYAFAKVMDPDSVVREGEYATAQRYAQSWLENFGFNAARVVNNQEFLTEEAVRNIKAAIQNKYNASEKAYRNIYGTYAQRVREAGGDPNRDLVDYSKPITGGVGTLEDYVRTNPTDLPKVERLIQENPTLSDEDILQIVTGGTGFSSVGGDTNAAAIAQAIKQVETGGNYSASGQSGEYGAYQFMPNTWKQWAAEFLGDANAPMTRENQDAVAQAKIQQWLEQGYNPQQIALLWNSGSTTPKKGVNKHGVAYDSGAYAQKVLGALS